MTAAAAPTALIGLLSHVADDQKSSCGIRKRTDWSGT